MKTRFFFFVGIMCIAGFGVFAISFAQGGQEGRKVVEVGEVIEGDYIAAGETIEIAGVVQGDVYVLGGQVLVSGTIQGDLLALGGIVSISGSVEQNIRMAGWQVIVSGNVGRNVTAGGMNIEFTKGSSVQGAVVAGGANIVANGPIERGAKVAGKNLVVSSTINGDLEAAVEIIRLTQGAGVSGDFIYWSNREASVGEGVMIGGDITKKAAQGPGAYIGQVTQPITQLIRPFLGIASFLTSLVLGMLVIRLLPDYSRQTVDTLRSRIWRSVTSGITTLLVIPIVFGLLIITVVGIPLGFLLLMVSSLMLYCARIFIMLWIGMVISERLGKNISSTHAFIIGLIVYSVVVQMPVIGWAVSFVAVLFGLGAAVQTAKEKYFARGN